jgi:hypothetical protein
VEFLLKWTGGHKHNIFYLHVLNYDVIRVPLYFTGILENGLPLSPKY